jgi:hypothetical protein
MALHGFRHAVKWHEYTTVTVRPLGEFRAKSKTIAPWRQTKKLKIYKNDKGIYRFNPSTVVVELTMDKKKSWVLAGAQTDELLQHEQGHYNIYALAAREFERGTLALGGLSEKDLKSLYSSLFKSIKELMYQVDADYDDQLLWGTDGGEKESQQEMWNFHIDRQMNMAGGELVSIYQTQHMKRPSELYFPGLCGFDPI